MAVYGIDHAETALCASRPRFRGFVLKAGDQCQARSFNDVIEDGGASEAEEVGTGTTVYQRFACKILHQLFNRMEDEYMNQVHCIAAFAN